MPRDAGTFSTGGAAACMIDPANTHSPTDSAAAIPCPNGYVSAPGSAFHTASGDGQTLPEPSSLPLVAGALGLLVLKRQRISSLCPSPAPNRWRRQA